MGFSKSKTMEMLKEAVKLKEAQPQMKPEEVAETLMAKEGGVWKHLMRNKWKYMTGLLAGTAAASAYAYHNPDSHLGVINNVEIGGVRPFNWLGEQTSFLTQNSIQQLNRWTGFPGNVAGNLSATATGAGPVGADGMVYQPWSFGMSPENLQP